MGGLPLIWEEVEAGTSRRRLVEIGHESPSGTARPLGSRRPEGNDRCHDARLCLIDEVYPTEVRGDSDLADGDGKRREREVDDHSAHGLTSRAATAINELASNPAFWPLMTEEDWMVIREIPAVIRSMIRESGH